jgi:hypothetical protein
VIALRLAPKSAGLEKASVATDVPESITGGLPTELMTTMDNDSEQQGADQAADRTGERRSIDPERRDEDDRRPDREDS